MRDKLKNLLGKIFNVERLGVKWKKKGVFRALI